MYLEYSPLFLAEEDVEIGQNVYAWRGFINKKIEDNAKMWDDEYFSLIYPFLMCHIQLPFLRVYIVCYIFPKMDINFSLFQSIPFRMCEFNEAFFFPNKYKSRVKVLDADFLLP